MFFNFGSSSNSGNGTPLTRGGCGYGAASPCPSQCGQTGGSIGCCGVTNAYIPGPMGPAGPAGPTEQVL